MALEEPGPFVQVMWRTQQDTYIFKLYVCADHLACGSTEFRMPTSSRLDGDKVEIHPNNYANVILLYLLVISCQKKMHWFTTFIHSYI